MPEENKTYRWVGIVMVFALLIFAFSYLANRLYDTVETRLGASSPIDGAGDLLSYERNTIEVFQQASPAVVFVHNLQNQLNLLTLNLTEVQQGTGSGFLWDRSGHIVTNYHVVQGANRVAVTLIDGQTYVAAVVGAAPRMDLAVLKIDLVETNVQPFAEKLADSSQVLVGQKAIAIGNPFGLDHTLTVGAVSAVGRTMDSIVPDMTIRDMIQTDAAVNRGNSGGPLLDSRGYLLGMNSMFLSRSTGIGFAVPSNTIGRVVVQIIEYGRPLQTGIGVSVFSERLTQGFLRQIGLQGVVVEEVSAGSPAERAGLRGMARDAVGNLILGDVIMAIDGQPMRSRDDMFNAFDAKSAGDEIELTYYRDGEQHSTRVKVINVSE